jgi:3-deoxy-D-manno-octulosonic-acid transferase
MPRLIYTLAVLLLLPWAVLHLLWRSAAPAGLPAPLGRALRPLRHRAQTPMPTIWLHAVSVGETRAAQPLVSALRQRFPDHRILLTHMTPTGRATSESLYGDSVSNASTCPMTHPGRCDRFLRRFLARASG